MMQPILLFGLIVLFGAQPLATFILNCNAPSKEALDTVNSNQNIARKMLSRKFKIANMQEMLWDQSLEKKAMNMKSCDDLKHGADYRIDSDLSEESYKIWNDFTLKNSKKQFPWYSDEHYNPRQSSFIHCRLSTPCQVLAYNYTSGNLDEYYREDIYLYGPRGTFDGEDIKLGKPGSKCPEGMEPEGWEELCAIPQ